MSHLKDLIVNGVARVLGKLIAKEVETDSIKATSAEANSIKAASIKSSNTSHQASYKTFATDGGIYTNKIHIEASTRLTNEVDDGLLYIHSDQRLNNLIDSGSCYVIIQKYTRKRGYGKRWTKVVPVRGTTIDDDEYRNNRFQELYTLDLVGVNNEEYKFVVSMHHPDGDVDGPMTAGDFFRKITGCEVTEDGLFRTGYGRMSFGGTHISFYKKNAEYLNKNLPTRHFFIPFRLFITNDEGVEYLKIHSYIPDTMLLTDMAYFNLVGKVTGDLGYKMVYVPK